MRKLLLAIFCFLLFESNTYAQITISGQVKNAPDSTEVLISYFNNPIENLEIVVGNSLLDDTGYFLYTNELKEKTFAKIRVGEYYFTLYLVPGDTIQLYTEYYEFFEKMTFDSHFKNELNYLVKEKIESFIYKIKPVNKYKNPFDYIANVDSVNSKHSSFYNNYVKEFKDPYFIKYKREELKYIYIYYRSFFARKEDANDLPNSYYGFLDSIDLTLPKVLWMQYYEQSISALFYAKCIRFIPNVDNFSNLKLPEKESIILIEFNYLKNNFNGDLRDYLLSDFMKYWVSAVKSDTTFVNKLLDQYKTLCKNELYKKHIQNFYIKRTNLNKSQIPNFEFQTIYGEKINLHSLKGKVIYIDFWATWCYPCLVYLKDYPALQEKYKNRTDIVYLFININDDAQRWSSFVLDKPSYGINWFADKATSKKLSGFFDIDAIPHYIIVDKNLKIIDVDADIPKNVEFP